VHVQRDPEVVRLRALLRDLVALSAIPVAWIGSDPPMVAAGLADTLMDVLQLDFAFVRLSDPGGAEAVEVTREINSAAYTEWLQGHLVAAAPPLRREIVCDGDGSERRALVVPVGVNGEAGVVAVAAERRDFPTPTDELLLSLATNHAAAACQSARLILDRKRAEEELRQARMDLEVRVQERTAELVASRKRIVAASDDARLRIERDLHDGLQQRLVSLGLALRAAEVLVPPEGEELRAEMSAVVSGLRDALDELQLLSRGIHPAILSQGGLGPALRTIAGRSAIPVDLEITAEASLPEAIEVAAYYVTSEALANAAKYAQASCIRVSLSDLGGTLLLSIRDDGVGGADPRHGSGLTGLRDRVEALGGTIEFRSHPGEGTEVSAELPLDVDADSRPAPRGAP
jgi:signal transduction histidine kinase